jgi:hypothetical protein
VDLGPSEPAFVRRLFANDLRISRQAIAIRVNGPAVTKSLVPLSWKSLHTFKVRCIRLSAAPYSLGRASIPRGSDVI